MGNDTLHFHVSHMQCNAVYVAISFQSCATDSQWAEPVAQAFTNEQHCKADWMMIHMVAIRQGMNSKLTHNSHSICSRTGHGVDCVHQRFHERQCMHTMINITPDWCMQSMLKMSRLGNVKGSPNIHKGNIHRDLMKGLGNPSIPEPYMVQVPMVLSKRGIAKGQQGNVAFPIMLPNELMAYYFKEHSSNFYNMYMGTSGSAGGARNALEEFWTSVEKVGGPRLDHHPMKRSPHWKTTYIPMAIHGEAVPVIKVGKSGSKSIDATSINPLMAIGQTKIIKQFVVGLSGKCNVATSNGNGHNEQIIHGDNNTAWNVWRVVMWPLHFAFLVIWSACDADGNAYDAKLRGYSRWQTFGRWFVPCHTCPQR